MEIKFNASSRDIEVVNSPGKLIVLFKGLREAFVIGARICEIEEVE